ncbi:hypothetical protein BDV96DRAFT_643053 [Lophiotrema nucula]|uniref:Uncharacterized protein n=1 Tax=Lophiotrema nucula TaxID=690887 RepID=A0A6A5ZIA1_9PLEO|nr:hypothetical protein BDV96DRAFT_643053 [Lophiotrema nucula]
MSADSIQALYGPEPTTPRAPRSPSSYVNEYISGKTLPVPLELDLPTIQPVPPVHSRPESACSSTSWWSVSSRYSTPDTSPSPVELELEPIRWSIADLNYLISILYPDYVLKGHIHFAPPLQVLPDHGAFNVILYTNTALPPSLQTNYHCPFPANFSILAESGRCTNPPQARQAIAAALLRDYETVNDLCAKYNVISSLLAMSTAKLQSVLRTVPLMQKIKEKERFGRSWQLKDVDETYDIGARLEAFLLEPGWIELSAWGKCVEYALSLEEKVRMGMGEVYGAVGEFLRRAVEE